MKKLIKYFLIIIFILVILIYIFFIEKDTEDYFIENKIENNISFEQKKLKICLHNYNNDFLSFMGGAVLDIENDGKNEVFITGGDNQRDCFLKFENGKFVNFIDETSIGKTEASYGVYAIDFTNNGSTDILVARESGVYLYENKFGKFKEKLIFNSFEKKSSPVDISLSDFDHDGDIDIYISTFIKAEFFTSTTYNKKENRQKNYFLENLGNLNFKDITRESGLEFSQNVFTGAFIDLDGDTFEDLVLSTNTDKIKIYKNNKGKNFSLVSEPSDYGFWMGLGLSDFDNDGKVDLFFSNSGDSIPVSFLKGDLLENQKFSPKYIFLRNKGDFKFEDVTKKISKNDFSFGWGIIPFDFNSDNIDDFLIMQNYAKWFFHKIKKLSGSFLINNNGFLQEGTKSSNLENKNFGFSSLISDFDGDDLEDILFLNIGGSLIFNKNLSKTNSKKLSVSLPMNLKYKNARAKISFNDGSFLEKSSLKKQGIMTTQDSKLNFYYKDKKIKDLEVYDNYGKKEVYEIKGGQKNIFIR